MDSNDSNDSDGERVKACHLRFTDALTDVPNGDAQAASELLLQERGLTSLDSLEPFKNLKKLELKGNHLASLSWLEMNHSLCWLGLAKNRLRRINHLQNLSSLAVLDISDNNVTRLDGLHGLQALKALIAARNRILSLDGISPKKNPLLETVVLSHNRLETVSLAGFKHLKKLSLANNRLHAFPRLQKLPALAELRLNGNQITIIPSLVTTLPHLTTLDVGKNLINQSSGFETLKGLLWLANLNVRGNPASGEEEMPQDIHDILGTLPRLEIVNGKKRQGHPSKRTKANGRGRGRVGNARGRGMAKPEASEEVPSLRGRGRGNGTAPGKPKTKTLVKKQVERAPSGANHFNSATAAKTSAMEKNSPSSLSKKKMRSHPLEDVTKKPHVERIGKKTMKVKKKLKSKTSRRA